MSNFKFNSRHPVGVNMTVGVILLASHTVETHLTPSSPLKLRKCRFERDNCVKVCSIEGDVW